MMNTGFRFCMTMFLYVYCKYAIADHPTVVFGIEGAGPINTISANSLPSGNWGFGIQTEVIANDEFSTAQLENFASSGLEGVHSLDQIINTSFSASYGLTEDLSVSVRLPYIKRENIREGELELGVPEAHTHGDSSGFGDLLLLGQYRVSNGDVTDVSVHFGIKTPTGETDVKDIDGIRFETEFQPGSGSWDFLVGAAISNKSGKLGYHANVLYNITTEGSQFTEIGDALSYNAAITYRLGDHDHASHDHSKDDEGDSDGSQWDLIVELNGETRSKNKISGISEDNSGGTVVYLSPGFRISSGTIGGFISLGFPVVEEQNGKQTDQDKRFTAGISFAL